MLFSSYVFMFCYAILIHLSLIPSLTGYSCSRSVCHWSVLIGNCSACNYYTYIAPIVPTIYMVASDMQRRYDNFNAEKSSQSCQFEIKLENL